MQSWLRGGGNSDPMGGINFSKTKACLSPAGANHINLSVSFCGRVAFSTSFQFFKNMKETGTNLPREADDPSSRGIFPCKQALIPLLTLFAIDVVFSNESELG